MHCPTEIEHLLDEKFGFPANPLFGVVSTRHEEGVNCRTMRIYMFDNGQPVLLTHTCTQKWREFNANTHIAICMVSEDKLTQVIVRGTATLETGKMEYWQKIREDVKQIYAQDYTPDQPYQAFPPLEAPKEVPETSGSVTVQPIFWESLELVLPYTESRRFHYYPEGTEWKQVPMSLG